MGVDEWFRTMDRGSDKGTVLLDVLLLEHPPLPLITIYNVIIVHVYQLKDTDDLDYGYRHTVYI